MIIKLKGYVMRLFHIAFTMIAMTILCTIVGMVIIYNLFEGDSQDGIVPNCLFLFVPALPPYGLLH